MLTCLFAFTVEEFFNKEDSLPLYAAVSNLRNLTNC